MFSNGQLMNDWHLESLVNESYLELKNEEKEKKDKEDYEKIVKYVNEKNDIFLSPYTNEEINNFERKSNIKLPLQLRNYLTTISKNYYITKFNQNSKYNILLENEDKLSSKCFLNNNIYSSSELYNFDDDTKKSIENGDGTIFLRNIGCGYTDFIVINGKYTGTVWSEELCGDGAIRMINSTFYKYIIDNLEL